MRHKFTAEETVKGFKRAAQVRRDKLKLQKKELKERSKEWFWGQVGKLTEAEKLPYLAAFTYGALAAAESHKELDPLALASESFRQGIEAILFLDCAKNGGSSLTGNPTQIFGIAGLTAIGLQVPLSAIGDLFTKGLPEIWTQTMTAKGLTEEDLRARYATYVGRTLMSGGTPLSYEDWKAQLP